jgi:hypothetical protein
MWDSYLPMLGGGGELCRRYLFRYAIPSVVTNDVAFAFDVVFAFRSKASQRNFVAYYCLRICKTIKALFDIVDSWQQRRRIIPLVHRIV